MKKLKYTNPSDTTLQKVKRIQAMIEENYPPLAACSVVGLSVSAFYMYRKTLGLKVSA